MTLPFDIARCPGLYQGINGEFGQTLHPACIDCLRRTAPGGDPQWWMTAPEFVGECPSKITGEKS